MKFSYPRRQTLIKTFLGLIMVAATVFYFLGQSAPEMPVPVGSKPTPVAHSAPMLLPTDKVPTVVQSARSQPTVMPLSQSASLTVPVPSTIPSPAAGLPAVSDDPPESKAPNLAVGRELRLKELLDQAAKDPNPQTAQRTRLTVGGYFVGDGKWEDARKVYEELTASPFVEVRHAASRNLQVVMKNIALEAETDFKRREWLQLDLAALHQTLGHEKFAKTMLRNLQANSIQDVVRQQAAQRLASYVTPSLPILPENPDRDKP